jgi:hypothetical protein
MKDVSKHLFIQYQNTSIISNCLTNLFETVVVSGEVSINLIQQKLRTNFANGPLVITACPTKSQVKVKQKIRTYSMAYAEFAVLLKEHINR